MEKREGTRQYIVLYIVAPQVERSFGNRTKLRFICFIHYKITVDSSFLPLGAGYFFFFSFLIWHFSTASSQTARTKGHCISSQSPVGGGGGDLVNYLLFYSCTRQNGHRDKFRCYRRFHDQGHPTTSKIWIISLNSLVNFCKLRNEEKKMRLTGNRGK